MVSTKTPTLLVGSPPSFSWDPDIERIIRRVFYPEYRVNEKIGQGGMAAVFKASSQADREEKVIAIKILHTKFLEQKYDKVVDQFFKEIRLIKSILHENVIKIIGDWGYKQGFNFYVMEWIEGLNLSEHIEKGRFERTDAVRIIRSILEALCYLHEKGITHRDLKPSNIMIEKETKRSVICDFGMAELLEGVDRVYSAIPGGTVAYMPPEQIDNMRRADFITDVYAAGLIGLELLGIPREPPLFKGSEKSEIKAAKKAITYDNIKNMSIIKDGDSLVDVYIKAILPDPKERWQSAKLMLDEVSKYCR